MKTFLNYGIRVSISSDDDGIFDMNILTWDFFVCGACMEFTLLDYK